MAFSPRRWHVPLRQHERGCCPLSTRPSATSKAVTRGARYASSKQAVPFHHPLMPRDGLRDTSERDKTGDAAKTMPCCAALHQVPGFFAGQANPSRRRAMRREFTAPPIRLISLLLAPAHYATPPASAAKPRPRVMPILFILATQPGGRSEVIHVATTASVHVPFPLKPRPSADNSKHAEGCHHAMLNPLSACSKSGDPPATRLLYVPRVAGAARCHPSSLSVCRLRRCYV